MSDCVARGGDESGGMNTSSEARWFVHVERSCAASAARCRWPRWQQCAQRRQNACSPHAAAAAAECDEAELCRLVGGGCSSDSAHEHAEHSEQNEVHVCVWYVHDVEHVIEHVICDVDALSSAPRSHTFCCSVVELEGMCRWVCLGSARDWRCCVSAGDRCDEEAEAKAEAVGRGGRSRFCSAIGCCECDCFISSCELM